MNKYLNSRTGLMMGVAGSLAVTILVWLYLKRAEDKLNARYQMTRVLVAKKYIPLGKDIKLDFFEEKKIPVTFLEPTALTDWDILKSDLAKAKIKTRIGLLKGEQITESKLLEESGYQSLAWTLPSDQTAVALRLSSEQAVGGHLKPGDWVTVFATFDLQPGIRDSASAVILPRCQIVALQEHVWDPGGGPPEKMEWKDLSNDLILVTLSVSPDRVERLMLASVKGRVCLSLLPAINPTPVRLSRMTLTQMMKN